MGEVEAQACGIDERTGLLDVGAENLAQRGVEQVGAGVVAADRVAALAVNDRVYVVADGQRCLSTALCARTPCTGRTAACDLGNCVLPSGEVNQPVSPIWPPESP